MKPQKKSGCRLLSGSPTMVKQTFVKQIWNYVKWTTSNRRTILNQNLLSGTVSINHVQLNTWLDSSRQAPWATSNISKTQERYCLYLDHLRQYPNINCSLSSLSYWNMPCNLKKLTSICTTTSLLYLHHKSGMKITWQVVTDWIKKNLNNLKQWGTCT